MKMGSTSDAWDELPLFAPEGAQIPKLGEDQSAETVTSAIGALSHLLYDEETPVEASELLREEGNRHFKRGRKGYRSAIKKYNDAIDAAGVVKEALAPALLNRSIAEFKLENYGRALQDVERSLSLIPGNVKAHYRALLCALRLEQFDVAQRHCESGLRLLSEDVNGPGRGDVERRRDVALFKAQRLAIEKAMAKSRRYERDRNLRLQAEQSRKQAVESMLHARGVTMGLPLFAQQRKYSSSEPVERNGIWYWPVLLVYPEDVVGPGNGDQSDFLEDIAETTTMSDMLETVFAEGLPPPAWDLNRAYRSADALEMRYRTRWTMELDEADSDEEQRFCGSSLPADEVGHWINVSNDTTLRELLGMKNYITPMFPVLYVIPRVVELP